VAIQVKRNDDMPFCWWRAEQTFAKRGLCGDTGLIVKQTASKLRGSGRDFTRIRSIDDLAMALK